MSTLSDFLIKYSALDRIDLELILAHALKKNREFILTHPETTLTKIQKETTTRMISRRIKHESIAHILEKKDFYNLSFKVSAHTLIPRPETELLIDEVMKKISTQEIDTIIDIGTGSGNIIISLAYLLKDKKITYFGTDISKEALKIAKYNAKKYNLDKKIKFIEGDLLTPFMKNIIVKNSKTIIIANLPYLSKKIYLATAPDVKNYEPKSALYSSQNGLAHYIKLFKQLNILQLSLGIKTIFIEFSPEQRNDIKQLIKQELISARIHFKKDLAKKWRLCMTSLD